MANLFIGFPVPRAKIAEMIEGAAPPLEHKENHLPDGSDALFPANGAASGKILRWTGSAFEWISEPAGAPSISPISVPPAAFQPTDDQTDYKVDHRRLLRRTSLTIGYFYAPVFFPHGATVTGVTLFAYRDDYDAAVEIQLHRGAHQEGGNVLCGVGANWGDGFGSRFSDNIVYPQVDNSLYSYCLYCKISPNDSVNDVRFIHAQIDFT